MEIDRKRLTEHNHLLSSSSSMDVWTCLTHRRFHWSGRSRLPLQTSALTAGQRCSSSISSSSLAHLSTDGRTAVCAVSLVARVRQQLKHSVHRSRLWSAAPSSTSDQRRRKIADEANGKPVFINNRTNSCAKGDRNFSDRLVAVTTLQWAGWDESNRSSYSRPSGVKRCSSRSVFVMSFCLSHN